MDPSIILGKAFAIYFIVMAFVMFQNKTLMISLVKDSKSSGGSYFLFGAMIFLLGLLFVQLHNVWTGGWQIVLSVICWGTLVKGLCYLFAPKASLAFARKWLSVVNIHVSAFITLAVGLYLGYELFVV